MLFLNQLKFKIRLWNAWSYKISLIDYGLFSLVPLLKEKVKSFCDFIFVENNFFFKFLGVKEGMEWFIDAIAKKNNN